MSDDIMFYHDTCTVSNFSEVNNLSVLIKGDVLINLPFSVYVYI